jgi:endonuclease/exonuclease/phosphatase family metal-dependent hydrolase
MTFNLRFENDRDGLNAWFYRRELVIRLIERYRPCILGTQEGKWAQLLYLQDHLRDYEIHAPKRVLDDTCQYPTLYYRADRFEVPKGAEFWLSKTPKVHRSKDWDSAFPRMLSYAALVVRDSGELLWAGVTHLDHMGQIARYEQSRILTGWVRRHRGPVILMGDFNDRPGSPVHGALVGPETGLRDTWSILGRDEDDESLTHHGFNGIPQKARIDWILVSGHFSVKNAVIVKDHFQGRYPSDHFPYLADLTLKGPGKMSRPQEEASPNSS